MPTIIQNRYGSVVNTSAPTLAFSAAPASGNLLIVANGWSASAPTITSVTDSTNNTYTTASPKAIGVAALALQAHQSTNVAAAAHTVTWHLSATAGHHLFISEISGHNTTSIADGVTSTNGTASGTNSAGSLNTNHADDLLLGMFRHNSNTTFTSAANYNIVGTPSQRLGVVQRSVVSTAAYNPQILQQAAGGTSGWVALHLPVAAADAGGVAFDAALTASGVLAGSLVMHVPFTGALTGQG